MSFVLLCYCRDMEYPYPTGPALGIMALGCYLEQHGVEVEYYDERVHDEERLTFLMKRGPLAAGLSVMGGHQIMSSQELSAQLRERYPRTPIIWGGFFPTMAPRVVLESTSADVAVIGEGEKALLRAAEHLEGGGNIREARIPGAATLDENGDIRVRPKGALLDIDELPFPYQGKARALLRPFESWIHGPTREKPGIELSRGCPGRCAFCYNRVLGAEARPRVKSKERIERDLEDLRRVGLCFVDIYDDTLAGGAPASIEEATRALGEAKVSWYANMRADSISTDLAFRMNESGCRWLFVGVESMSGRVLEALRKGVPNRRIPEAVDSLFRAGIPVTYSLLALLPGEAGGEAGGETSVEAVLYFADELHRRHPSAEIQIQSFVPLPGTPLWETALGEGHVPPTSLEEWSKWDHLRIESPLSEDPSLPARLYITSFLAYRARRHLPAGLPRTLALPFQLLAKARIRRRFFGLFFEQALVDSARFAGRVRHRLAAGRILRR